MNQNSLYIDDGDHQLHVRHIWQQKGGIPVLMLHGTIENGRIFYTESGKGLACYLASKGFEVFVADFRGKGKSTPAVHESPEHGQHESINRDIPRFIDSIVKRNPQKIHVICHSWGGVLFASFLARYPVYLNNIASSVCFGTKRSIYSKSVGKFFKINMMWNFLAPKFARKKGYIDAKKLKFGAENETARFLRHSISWIKPGLWRDPEDGFDYQTAAKSIEWPPTWHLTGAKDKVLGNANDVKAFIDESYNEQAKLTVLSKQSGNQLDYDHIDILIHPKSEIDHFPEVAEWLKKHS